MIREQEPNNYFEKPVVYIHVIETMIMFMNVPVLYGRVYNHPRIPDGHRIYSSPIIRRRGGFIETENTIYIPTCDFLQFNPKVTLADYDGK